MGDFMEWRMFLLRLFAFCFSATMPEVDFCVQLIDMMQYLAPCFMDKKRPRFDPQDVVRRVTERAAWHQNLERDPERPCVRRATVLMFDTPHQVPKNKSGTQKSRDSRCPTLPGAGGAPKNDPVLLTGDDGPWMDESLYNQLREIEQRPFLLRLDRSEPLPLANTTVWRSVSLRLQLYRLLTHALLHSPVADGQALVIDDGVAVSEERFVQLMEEVLRDHPETINLSRYEREIFVHQVLVEHQHYSRFVLYDDRQFKRFLPSNVGEADIKIQAYIQRDNGAKRFLVVNQDTDVIFILLLHMNAFLEGATQPQEEHEDLEVWIDCLSPSGKEKDKPYRWINVKALYFALIDLFAKHFPTVQHPIETFCALVFCLKTDYTTKFASCVGVKAGLVWETFAQLHNVAEPLPWSTRPVTKGPHPREMFGVLQHAVQYADGQFWLDRTAWTRFNYYLCQQGLVQVRQQLQLYCTPGLLSPEALLVYAGEVAERVATHCEQEAQREQEVTQGLKRLAPAPDTNPRPQKAFRASSRRVAVEREHTVTHTVTEDASMDEIFARPLLTPGNDMQTFLTHHRETLRKLARKKVPPQCGVPAPQEMLARFQRLQWYLWYCRHGYEDPHCATTCVEQDARGRSLWGWREKPSDVCNSTYNGARYDGTQFTYYGVEECTNVI